MCLPQINQTPSLPTLNITTEDTELCQSQSFSCPPFRTSLQLGNELPMTVPSNCPFKATFPPERRVPAMGVGWTLESVSVGTCQAHLGLQNSAGKKDGQHCTSYSNSTLCWAHMCSLRSPKNIKRSSSSPYGNRHSKQLLQRQQPAVVVLPFQENEGSVFVHELGA